MWGLRRLSPQVLWFHWRARRLAWRMHDLFSITSVTRPPDTRVLLDLAKRRTRIVELGTATGWTAITLALDDEERHVITYDPFDRSEPELYLSLVRREVRDRIKMVTAAGSTGPRDRGLVDLLYIDSSHEREQTIEEVRAWQPHLRAGALIVFDDYTHPDFPGIREAVEDLALEGEQRGMLFIHRHHHEQVMPNQVASGSQ